MAASGKRIDFTGLNQFMSQFEGARDHFVRSQREMILALRSVLDILSKADGIGGGPHDPGRAGVILAGRAVLDYVLAHLPNPDSDEAFRSKAQALASVLEVVEREHRRLSVLEKDEVVAAKLEALASIKKVIDREMDEAKTRRPKSGPRISKVKIE